MKDNRSQAELEWEEAINEVLSRGGPNGGRIRRGRGSISNHVICSIRCNYGNGLCGEEMGQILVTPYGQLLVGHRRRTVDESESWNQQQAALEAEFRADFGTSLKSYSRGKPRWAVVDLPMRSGWHPELWLSCSRHEPRKISPDDLRAVIHSRRNKWAT